MTEPTAYVQKIDGKNHLFLPKGITAQDFANWLNDAPDKPPLNFIELPERWSSAEEQP